MSTRRGGGGVPKRVSGLILNKAEPQERPKSDLGAAKEPKGAQGPGKWKDYRVSGALVGRGKHDALAKSIRYQFA